MQLFYDPDLKTGDHQLAESEARHLMQVLRKKMGDTIDLVNGKGGWFKAELLETSKKNCLLNVAEVRKETKRRPYQVTLAFGPPKTADRLEWLLEKATEIGVDRLQPFVSAHSERRKLRPERLEKVLESAMKQSLQAWLPQLLPLQKFADVLPLEEGAIGLIAWIDKTVQQPLIRNYQPGQDVTILIGPEGGFSQAEAELAIAAGYLPGSLGTTRLRTETAAIAALRDVEATNLNTL